MHNWPYIEDRVNVYGTTYLLVEAIQDPVQFSNIHLRYTFRESRSGEVVDIGVALNQDDMLFGRVGDYVTERVNRELYLWEQSRARERTPRFVTTYLPDINSDITGLPFTPNPVSPPKPKEPKKIKVDRFKDLFG
jgi:hypothetical protein